MTRSLALIASTLTVVLIVAGLTLAFRHGTSTSKVLATGVVVPSPVVSVPAQVERPPSVIHRRSHLRREPSLDWNALAACESSGNWQDTAGYYQGGLQFAPRTWASFHGTDFAARADLATRAEQIAVAERVLRRQGLAAWPACTRKLGWVQ